jgi:hypothetical protein
MPNYDTCFLTDAITQRAQLEQSARRQAERAEQCAREAKAAHDTAAVAAAKRQQAEYVARSRKQARRMVQDDEYKPPQGPDHDEWFMEDQVLPGGICFSTFTKSTLPSGARLPVLKAPTKVWLNPEAQRQRHL